jgi:hypothetical protein
VRDRLQLVEGDGGTSPSTVTHTEPSPTATATGVSSIRIGGSTWFVVVEEMPFLFFAAVAIGVFNKESMLGLLPAYPLGEWIRGRRFLNPKWVGVILIYGASLALRELIPIPVNRYSVLAEFAGVSFTKTVLIAVVVALGVVLVPMWRAFAYPLSLSLIPFVAFNLAAAWFAGDTGRIVIQILPFLVLAFVSYIPTSNTKDMLLAMIPAGAYLVQEFTGTVSFHYEIVLLLLLVVAASEGLLFLRSPRRPFYPLRLSRRREVPR